METIEKKRPYLRGTPIPIRPPKPSLRARYIAAKPRCETFLVCRVDGPEKLIIVSMHFTSADAEQACLALGESYPCDRHIILVEEEDCG